MNQNQKQKIRKALKCISDAQIMLIYNRYDCVKEHMDKASILLEESLSDPEDKEVSFYGGP